MGTFSKSMVLWVSASNVEMNLVALFTRLTLTSYTHLPRIRLAITHWLLSDTPVAIHLLISVFATAKAFSIILPPHDNELIIWDH